MLSKQIKSWSFHVLTPRRTLYMYSSWFNKCLISEKHTHSHLDITVSTWSWYSWVGFETKQQNILVPTGKSCSFKVSTIIHIVHVETLNELTSSLFLCFSFLISSANVSHSIFFWVSSISCKRKHFFLRYKCDPNSYS